MPAQHVLHALHVPGSYTGDSIKLAALRSFFISPPHQKQLSAKKWQLETFHPTTQSTDLETMPTTRRRSSSPRPVWKEDVRYDGTDYRKTSDPEDQEKCSICKYTRKCVYYRIRGVPGIALGRVSIWSWGLGSSAEDNLLIQLFCFH